MPTPNEWRSDIVLVDNFPTHLKELTEDGYSVFSAVQHSVDGYYLIVSYPTGTANQLSFVNSDLATHDQSVVDAVTGLTSAILGGPIPAPGVGLATEQTQISGNTTLVGISGLAFTTASALTGIEAIVSTASLQESGNTSLNSIDNRVGTSGTTGTAVWELDQIRQLIISGYARDEYTSGIILPDQVGINGNNTLTFSFPRMMDRVHILVADPTNLNKQAVMRVDPFGGTPTASFGMAGLLNQEFEIHSRCQQVKVWFSGGFHCAVWGYYYE